MSKALVIKGASFAENKVETITISSIVPCTGISLSEDELTFTAIGATETLVATVTPADTTDSVTWESSNTDCVTVEDGVVTVVGVGSATITAYCGTQSAECSVVSTVSFNANDKFYLNGYELSGYNFSVDPPKDYISVYASARRRVYGDPVNVLNGFKAYAGNNASVGLDVVYPIVVPKGTTKISISVPSAFTLCKFGLQNANLPPSYDPTVTANTGARALAVTSYLSVSNNVAEYEIPSDLTGYNSFVFNLSTGNEDASTVTGDVIVTFS